MSTTIIIRTDKEIKQQAEILFKKLGLNLSSAINTFLRASLRKNGLPFELLDDGSNFNNTTIAAIEEGDEILKNPSLSKGHNNIDDLRKELEA